MPEDDGAFDATAELGVVEEWAVAGDQVAAKAGAARDLRDERPPARVGDVFGGGASRVAGDDDGARPAFDKQRGAAAAVALRRGVAGGGGGVEVGANALEFELVFGVGDGGQRFAEREVQVHGARSGDALRRADGVGPGLTGEGSRVEPFVAGVGAEARSGTGSGHIRREAGGSAENARLVGGLIRADAAQLGWSVGREQQHGHAAVVRLEHGGVQVGHGRSARHDHGGRNAGLGGQAQREESGDPFVESHVQVQ
jgi:hypothetical protein